MLIDTLVTFTPEFKREYKRLAKKHSSLATDLQELVASLKTNPTMGNVLVSDNSGNTAYKIRLAISSKNKGKSGGARVITYFLNKENELYLLSIYDKSEQSNISYSLLKLLIKSVV